MKRGGCWDCNHCGGSSQKRTVTGSREARYGTDRNECNRECKNLSSWVGRLCGKRGKTFWRTLNGPCQGRGERWNRVTETICVCVSVCYFNFLGGCINLCQPWFSLLDSNFTRSHCSAVVLPILPPALSPDQCLRTADHEPFPQTSASDLKVECFLFLDFDFCIRHPKPATTQSIDSCIPSSIRSI